MKRAEEAFAAIDAAVGDVGIGFDVLAAVAEARIGARGRPKLPRCDRHTATPPSTAGSCPACAALRGKPPTKRGKGTTGGQRGHPERKRVKPPK